MSDPVPYLRKATNAGICHCQCSIEDALVSPSAQADCPWCGCGWLWACAGCGKSFTFAERILLPGGLDAIVRRSRPSMIGKLLSPFRSDPSEDELMAFIAECNETGVVVRQPEDREPLRVPEHLYRMLVYFDGYPIPADVSGFRFVGQHGAHDLNVVPQVEALGDPAIVGDLLRNEAYWANAAEAAGEGT